MGKLLSFGRGMLFLATLVAVEAWGEQVTNWADSVEDPLNDRLLGIQDAMPVNTWGRGTTRQITYPDGSREVAIKIAPYSSMQWGVVVGTQFDAQGNPVNTQGSTEESGGVTEESINGEGGNSGSPYGDGSGSNPWQGGGNPGGGGWAQGQVCGWADGNYQCVPYYYNPGFP